MKELSTLDTIVTYALTPLSWIYGAVTTVRNKLFDIGVLPQTKYDIPVISVGNITVGGTGKTPHVEMLLSNLCFDFNIGVISRGYKRKTSGFIIANSKSTPDSIGDEPYQIYQKFGHRVKVAVSESRRKGIDKLLELHPEVNLILLDDAFQHRYVKPQTSIILVDYNRPIWDDRLLPLGRLRENRHSTDRADIVIITKCPDKLSPLDYRLAEKNLELLAFQKHYFSRFAYEPLKPVFPDDRPYDVTLDYFSSRDSVLLVTGIAQPRTFVRHFRNYPFRVKVSHFPDHHDFSRTDLEKILSMFNDMKGEHKIIVTTEKDAVRMLNNPYYPEELKPLTYFLPVKVEMINGKGDGSFLNDMRTSLGLPAAFDGDSEEEKPKTDIAEEPQRYAVQEDDNEPEEVYDDSYRQPGRFTRRLRESSWDAPSESDYGAHETEYSDRVRFSDSNRYASDEDDLESDSYSEREDSSPRNDDSPGDFDFRRRYDEDY